MRGLIVGLALVSLTVACTKKAPTSESGPGALSERGRKVYLASCSSCHNLDPAKDGSLGPAIVGSSLELVQHRVLNGDYPPDYKPKRETRLMVALPHLKNDIPALHAYLNSISPTGN